MKQTVSNPNAPNISCIWSVIYTKCSARYSRILDILTFFLLVPETQSKEQGGLIPVA